MEIELYTTKEIARILGITEVHVRRLCRGGIIKGRKIGRDWIITSYTKYLRARKRK